MGMRWLRRSPSPADFGKRLDGAAVLRSAALATRGGEPEVLVAALDGCAVAEAYPKDLLHALWEHRQHAMRLSIRADDQGPGAQLSHGHIAVGREDWRIERLCLAHAGSGREDDQVARLEAAGEPVEVGEARGDADLDRLTSGFQPGALVILAARPSMGK